MLTLDTQQLYQAVDLLYTTMYNKSIIEASKFLCNIAADSNKLTLKCINPYAKMQISLQAKLQNIDEELLVELSQGIFIQGDLLYKVITIFKTSEAINIQASKDNILQCTSGLIAVQISYELASTPTTKYTFIKVDMSATGSNYTNLTEVTSLAKLTTIQDDPHSNFGKISYHQNKLTLQRGNIIHQINCELPKEFENVVVNHQEIKLYSAFIRYNNSIGNNEITVVKNSSNTITLISKTATVEFVYYDGLLQAERNIEKLTYSVSTELAKNDLKQILRNLLLFHKQATVRIADKVTFKAKNIEQAIVPINIVNTLAESSLEFKVSLETLSQMVLDAKEPNITFKFDTTIQDRLYLTIVGSTWQSTCPFMRSL